ncbi:hypothetical protein PIGHUM_03686 [Pigmentiphaga humi]|uniref:Uncharacterized protein n=1 Tax=Pigmentiphaga humi TaxID=2478468 RepID=A0A3P4B6P9_9BURK|nr:hypothetical protein PIGHUM_03686 [Pigmentiphaga humi]
MSMILAPPGDGDGGRSRGREELSPAARTGLHIKP